MSEGEASLCTHRPDQNPNSDTTACWWVCGHQDPHSSLGEVGQLRREAAWQFSVELSTLTAEAITVLHVYSEELKVYFRAEMCTQMLTTALFIIAKTRKEPRCAPVGEWINCVMSKLGYYSALKRTGPLSHEKTRILNACC